MKTHNYLVGLSILFIVIAAVFSFVFRADVSLAAKSVSLYSGLLPV